MLELISRFLNELRPAIVSNESKITTYVDTDAGVAREHRRTIRKAVRGCVGISCGHRYRLSWAQALAKVFAVDVTLCPRCGQRGMQQIAVIHDARVLRTMQAAFGGR